MTFVKNKKPLLNEFQIETLGRIVKTPEIRKSELYDGRTEQKYVEELLLDEIIEETKCGQYNKKTIIITERGMDIYTKARELLALIRHERKNIESETKTHYHNPTVDYDDGEIRYKPVPRTYDEMKPIATMLIYVYNKGGSATDEEVRKTGRDVSILEDMQSYRFVIRKRTEHGIEWHLAERGMRVARGLDEIDGYLRYGSDATSNEMISNFVADMIYDDHIKND